MVVRMMKVGRKKMGEGLRKRYDRLWKYVGDAEKELYFNDDLGEYCFANKARQKEALGYLNRAYSTLREILRICYEPHCTFVEGYGYNKCELYGMYYDVPFDLHQIRLKKHYYIFITPTTNDATNSIILEKLVNKRNDFKNIEIVKPRPKSKKEQEVSEKVIKTFEEMFKLRKAQYDRALDVGKHFNYLPVYIKPHRVTNEYGTTFTRCFYYLRGELTPLNIIMAAAQKLESDKKGE